MTRTLGSLSVGPTSSALLMLISGGPPRRGALELWASNQTDLKLPCRQHLSPTVCFNISNNLSEPARWDGFPVFRYAFIFWLFSRDTYSVAVTVNGCIH